MKISEVVKQSRASIEKTDLEMLLTILVPMKPKMILEIGTWKGYSAEVWINAFSPDKFVTIEKDSKLPGAVEIENINHKYFWNTDSHHNDIKFNTEPYDFLFIDGAHDIGGVTKDWELYQPLVRENGIIVFHDALYHVDGTEEVDLLWEEIKKHYKHLEIKTNSNSTGIGVLFI